MTSIGSGAGVRWGWVWLGAVLLEVCTIPFLFAYMAVLSGLFGIQAVGAFDLKGWLIMPPFFFAVPIPFGVWIARRARQRLVLHGALVGLIAALLFVPALW